jgi:hypothetical protein
MNEIKQLIEEVKTKYKTNSVDEKKAKTDLIGLWLPDGYKIKYSQLQMDTNFSFGKDLQEIVKTTIDVAFKSRYP